ncbi:MAG TPA: ABC transporter permease subunit, partial [Anaerolineales bacterium]|nr:ABC transporter permease subunit [Anaerolineales bacterium]
MTTTAQSRPLEKTRFRARFNWPLILGTLLVGTIIYLALVGPKIAPHDPLQENMILKDSLTGEWHIPPFPAFEVTGYPLGSDEFGRDMYSRLLWAIGPTLQMVAIVALVRLLLGTLIGLLAGWSTGRLGGFFDMLISGALSLPGLLVALGTIAVVGVELGLIAFVIGLSITGWAETARIVREQTRLIKSQVYIEAANALGASGKQIVLQHVVRQIQAMLLMLLAFEIGSTLMLTAGLGFLGYYIGGDVWVDVSDFVAR